MHELSERAKKILPSKVRESLRVLESDSSIISLGVGEPDFIPCEEVIAAVKEHIRECTHYSPFEGKKELREELARKLKKDNKIEVEPDEIVVCCGSKEAILLSLLALVDPGDEVIIPDPGYLGFEPISNVVNGVPVSLHLKEEENFEINADRLKKSISEKTKILIINTPSNPTGSVLSKKCLEEIADIAVENDLIIVSDEAYEKLVYEDAKHVSIASLNGMKERVITTQTFSKSYAMCGFRIGYAAGPKEIIKKMVDLKVATTIAAPTISQVAALAALRKCGKYVEKMREEYDRRRRMLIKRLNEMEKMRCLTPKGAFYAFPNISELGKSENVVELFLKEAKVLTIPGTEFGKYGEGFIRLSYATSYEKIEEALDRMEEVIKRI